MKNKYVKKCGLEEHTLNVNKLTDIVSNLKWTYYIKYHQEPRFIKLPIWVYLLLRQYTHQLIGYYEIVDEGKTIPTYMGLKICDTISIDNIKDIEVF